MSGNVVVVKLQGTNGLSDAVRTNEPMDRIYLAEGNSWFDFPASQYFPSHVNLLTALNTGNKRTLVLSVIDSNNCLMLAEFEREPRGDWYDEIHPRPDGFAKVAALYKAPLADFSQPYDLLL